MMTMMASLWVGHLEVILQIETAVEKEKVVVMVTNQWVGRLEVILQIEASAAAEEEEEVVVVVVVVLSLTMGRLEIESVVKEDGEVVAERDYLNSLLRR
jgi:general stress protein CsbA